MFQFQFNNMDENISDDDMSNKSDDDDVEINLNVEKSEDSLNNKQPISIVSKFLPDFSRDEQIREALVYFHCTKTEDELRLDWPARRDVLVQVKIINLLIKYILKTFNILCLFFK